MTAHDRDVNARGFALITVVLLMIGLAVLASGLTYAAAQQATVTGSLRDLVRARHAAEGAVAHALLDWSAARRSLDSIGASVPVLAGVHLEPDVLVAVEARRLSGNAWLLSGSARVGRGELTPITHRSTRLVHSIDADSAGAALDAALIADAVRVEAGAAVSGAGGAAAPDAEAVAPGAETSALCKRWIPTGAALRAPPESVIVASGAVVTGTPLLEADADVARFRSGLDFLDLAELGALAVGVTDSLVTPGPATAGAACDTAAPGNWGAPDGACADRYVLVHATGPLTLDGGYGQGVLVVDGDVVLDGGVRFRGILLATGSVIIRNGGVDGSVAAARIIVEADGRAALDRCAVAAALARTPPLRRPHLPPRSWLPGFY